MELAGVVGVVVCTDVGIYVVGVVGAIVDDDFVVRVVTSVVVDGA